MNLRIGKMRPGQWRELTEEELATLLAGIGAER